MHHTSTLIFVIQLALCLARADRIDTEKSTLDRLLAPNHYDPTIRPKADARNLTGPVVVQTNMYIRDIRYIDDADMEYQIQVTFRQEWTDKRLSYDDHGRTLRYLTIANEDRIWTPDTFFSNEITGHFYNIITRNSLIRVFPSGRVLYSIRLGLTLSCPMDLTYYPLDKQLCEIIFASYGYTIDDVKYEWRDDAPIQLKGKYPMKKFSLNSAHTDYCNSRTTTGTYSCAKAGLTLSRNFRFYFIHVFMPCVFMVILSWIPFWLDYNNTTARVAIWVTILLTMTIVMSGIRSETRDIPFHTQNIDTWTGTCLTFMFAVVIELAIVNHLVAERNAAREKAGKIILENDDDKTVNLLSEDQEKPAENKKDGTSKNFVLDKIPTLKRWLEQCPSRALKIDLISRVAFPLAFLFFNICYWASFSSRP